MVTLSRLVVALFLLERALELVRSEKNARRLLERGALEAGRGHYLPLVLFHLGFLLFCAGLAARGRLFPPAVTVAALLLVLLAQALRYWAIATLGERWSTRILVLEDEPPLTGGPYRYLRHPNYLAVALELFCLPLGLGSLAGAIAFSLANAVLLAVRIRAEERALGERWQAIFRHRPRFFPRGVL